MPSKASVQIAPNTYSTDRLPARSVLLQMAFLCSWPDDLRLRTVKVMKSLQTTPPPSPQTRWQRLALQPGAAIQTLNLRKGQTLELAVQTGRVWLTQEGLPDDIILQPSQRMQFCGPARLHVGAADTQTAQLRWADISTAKLTPTFVAPAALQRA